MNVIEIDKKRDYIIAEIDKNRFILKDTKLYCGCCGNIIGIAKNRIDLSKSQNIFTKLKNKTFTIGILGLYHKTCGHTMFSFQRHYNFIDLTTYKKKSQNDN